MQKIAMRQLPPWLNFCAVFLILLSAWSAPLEAKDRVICLVLEAPDGSDHDIEVLNIASEAFLDSRSFQIVERSKLDEIIAEQELQSFTSGNIQLLGELAGCGYLGLVSYSVNVTRTDLGPEYEYSVSTRIVIVETASVLTTIRSEQARWKRMMPKFGKSGAATAAAVMTQTIREEFPVEGYVIKLSGGEMVVDLGKGAGVGKGDILAVIRQSEPIVHPVTKETLPGEERRVGRLKVVSASQATAVCEPKGKDSQVALGDRVRFMK